VTLVYLTYIDALMSNRVTRLPQKYQEALRNRGERDPLHLVRCQFQAMQSLWKTELQKDRA